MKLDPGERSILASFKDGPAAEAARDHLSGAGYQEVQLDRVDGHAGEPEPNDRGRPGLGETSQVTATLTGTGKMLDEDARVLLAASPEVSGMTGAPVDIIPPFLLTVVTTEQRVQEAVEILKSHGGRV